MTRAERQRASEKRAWLDVINSCDGAEVPKDSWPIVMELLVEGKIAHLGHARGPGKQWRRAYPNTVKEEER